MIRRVILIVEAPLSHRDFARFGLTHFADHGLDTEVWEIQDVYAPRPRAESVNRATEVSVRRFKSEADLVQSASSLLAEDCVILTTGAKVGQEASMWPLISAVASSRALFTALSSGHRLPQPSSQPEIHGRLTKVAARARTLSMDFRLNPRRIPVSFRSAWRSRCSRSRPRVRTLDAIWAGTTIEGIQQTLVANTTYVAFIHTLDYDQIRHSRSHPSGNAVGKIVYLDSMGPEHPDYSVHGIRLLTNSADWFASVRTAFSRIEGILNMPVAIVAHPRANRDRLEEWYGNREVLSGSTAQSIRDGEMALVTSGTTSLGIVAALQRPCIALRTPPIHATHLTDLCAYAIALGIPLIDYSSFPRVLRVPSPDAQRQASFVEQFVKRAGTPEGDFWDVVATKIVNWGQ